MARNPKLYQQSKKHLARLERERRTNRMVIIGSVVAITLVVLIVGYGLLDQMVLSNLRPVAVVNGEKITTKEWQSMVRFTRQRVINQMVNILQNYQLFAQIYGNDPSFTSYYSSQLSQLQQQLSPDFIGQQVLDSMIESKLLEQEAKKRNVTISEEEIDKMIEEVFGYYRDGTPTLAPTQAELATSTLSPTQYALVSPTPTSTNTPLPSTTPTLSQTAIFTATQTQAAVTPTLTPTITPTFEPTLTPTPYTYEAFQAEYQDLLKSYQEDIQLNEQDVRNIIRNQLLYEKMQETILAELGVTPEQEVIWARHILVEDEATAQEVLSKLNAGEDWTSLAAEYSTDTSNKDNGGDLGWFYRGTMVSEFENAAFALKEIGEISQPVQTQFGFHIIQLLGRETRRLSDTEWEQFKTNQFQKWLSDLRASAKIEIDESWRERVPAEPPIPEEIDQAILALTSTQNQPLVQPTSEIPVESTPAP
ncbi:MAG: Peptidyl-prolyl cis-trans isomerase PpiC [Anaerolineae bacterium]|nr:MAG: Peptidyl-prolyl cis-trans isomerase PpiC [Anaerolineae bacterium]